ncbi:PASTA domain-containing protein [Ornithinibacillus sp. 4-3]|uniref:PASTA domain-containing protein n=1 Tax=Ornithinibacillus sp. 4-3 TaxID=3231488 RepID=A0AB39HNL9_9BACI
MSDFLSKFNKDNYDDMVDEKGQKDQKDVQENNVEKQQEEQLELNQAEYEETEEQVDLSPKQDTSTNTSPLVSSRSTRRQDSEEEVEIDLDYRKKKKQKMIILIAGSVVAAIFLFFIYHMLVHVKLENFVDRPVSEVRAWATENDVEVELEQEYSMEHDANEVILQSVSEGDKIRKGKTLTITSSLGADPDETLPLPEFSEMNQEEARVWIDENKAENLQMVTEFSDDIEEGSFIKLTIKNSDIDPSEYTRKDSAAVYYSKGKEVFEKNITIPDFVGQPKEEVEKWVETNEIEMTYEEADSDSVEAGNIISQSEAAEGKIAKRDKMTVVVSAGKAIVVPNFTELTPDEAAMNYPDLNVTVKQRFHGEVAYGTMISQSVDAGTKLLESDDKNVTVTYSQGRPYLQDFRGQSEGDLPRLFYEQYKSKGADINYIVKYVDSDEIKGTVVGMGNFNEFVAMKYTVEIRISNNKYAPPNPPDFSEEGGDIYPEPDDEEIPEEVPEK